MNAASVKTWHEAGLTRRRTSISFIDGVHKGAAPNYDQFLDWFKKEGKATFGASNMQSWVGEGEAFVDSSYVMGPAGGELRPGDSRMILTFPDSIYDAHKQDALDRWRLHTGCCTGELCKPA